MNLPSIVRDVTDSALADELIVYVPSTGQAHCLNTSGKRVFEACKTGSSREELLNTLTQLGVANPEDAIDASLDEFESKGIIQVATGSNRRKFLQGAGALASAAIVASVVGPRPVQAVSCVLCALDAFGFPANNCADCNLSCKLNVGDACSGTSRCNFEFVRNSLNSPGGNNTLCQNELAGNYRCRGTLPNGFDCNALRATVADTFSYFCCSCPTAPANGALNFPAGGC